MRKKRGRVGGKTLTWSEATDAEMQGDLSQEQTYAKATALGGYERREMWIDEAREQLVGVDRKEGGCRYEFEFDGESILKTFVDLRSRCVLLYFMGRMPSEVDLARWAHSEQMSPYGIERMWFVGKGFFAAVLGSEQGASNLILKGATLYKGTVVQILPYVASFDPEAELKARCPVWISFPGLMGALREHAVEIAKLLGRVLYVPRDRFVEQAAGPRFCILWDLAKEVPNEIILNANPIGKLLVKVRFQPFPHACYICKSLEHFARNCPHEMKEGVDKRTEEKKEDSQPKTDTNKDTQIVVFQAQGTTHEESVKEGFIPVRGRGRRGRGQWRGNVGSRVAQGNRIQSFFGPQGAPSSWFQSGSGDNGKGAGVAALNRTTENMEFGRQADAVKGKEIMRPVSEIGAEGSSNKFEALAGLED